MAYSGGQDAQQLAYGSTSLAEPELRHEGGHEGEGVFPLHAMPPAEAVVSDAGGVVVVDPADSCTNSECRDEEPLVPSERKKPRHCASCNAKKIIRWTLASICLFGVVVSWVAGAEVVQFVQTDTDYEKPYFMTYCVHTGLILNAPVWGIWYIFRGRKLPPVKDAFSFKRYFVLALALSFVYFFVDYTWYLSLPKTSVSGNVAVNNISSMFVYILSVILIKERFTLTKLFAVSIGIGGAALVAVTASENSGVDTAVGYAFVITSSLLWGFYQVGFKRFGNDPATYSDHSLERIFFLSFLYLGLVGLCNCFTMWVGIPILDALGWEEFVVPSTDVIYQLLASEVSFLAFSCFTISGIVLSSPLFMTMGPLFCVPTSVVADALIHDYTLPAVSFLGVIIISGGFVMLFADEIIAAFYSDETKPEQVQKRLCTCCKGQNKVMKCLGRVPWL
ncbi:DUF6 domain protein [Pelomyxa schiedti]|nr:DUF6 domain protein [Pelomyxa schiedti]